MTDATIEMISVRKRYGETVALDGLSFEVHPGHVTGFIGPNGAGKSTAMRVILGLDRPDEGTALVSGQPFTTLHRPLAHVGALLDANALQPSRSGRNHLRWMAHSQRMPNSRVDEVLEMVGLAPAARRKAGGYSLGMRQRLGIAAALLGDPPVIIMDEPFNGMDPEGIIWMRALLRRLAAEGRAILISSHLMSELEDVADHVVVIGRGRVLADATIDELVARASGDTVTVRTDVPTDVAAALERAGGHAMSTGTGSTGDGRNQPAVSGRAQHGGTSGSGSTVDAGRSTAQVEVSGLTARQIVEALQAEGLSFSEVTSQRANLEDVYLQLTAGEAQFQAAPESEGGR